MSVHTIALTYAPKIKGVCKGEIRQTIRKVQKRVYKVGDSLIFHGWAGRPYWSAWDWRLTGLELKEVFLINLDSSGIVYKEDNTGTRLQVLQKTDLDELARLDGIDPPTGEELLKVLKGKNKKNPYGLFWVLRW